MLLERWKRRRNCFHHDPVAKVSFIRSQLIDSGMRKMFWCTRCQQTWFV